ncbi:wound-induced protein 1-like [Phalaenopsis equestris]|uniref:wound-induced protein 1-like n=1 Tax=Phalaenopsis equestris TaxID=78828 RepID=UPI0009E2FDF6|nr:wound-induced protein 1-like [Phalaenopsis equestris]
MPANDEENSRGTVLLLYGALEARDPELVQQLLAPNLDWRFHGPRSHQHMKRLLTGEHDRFQFLIQSIELVGTIVIAEGTDRAGDVFWVHAWTVSDGVITQLREYFNTSVTVRSLGGRCGSVWRSRIPESVGKRLPSLVLPI